MITLLSIQWSTIWLLAVVSDISASRDYRFLEAATNKTYHWGSWSEWTTCHVDCDRLTNHYTQTRSRNCLNQSGGRATLSHCRTTFSSLTYRQQRDCPTDSCPIWATWSSWSTCNLSCGNGSTIRVRHCAQGDCKGLPFETKSCTLRVCDTDGGWSTWSTWNQCDVSCGKGHTTRTRQCTNPAPSGTGKSCIGDAIETSTCNMTGCPIDGGWTDFKDRPCSVSCGTGVAVKVRTCTNPAPKFGGKNCTGPALQFDACTQPACVIDGGWSGWSNWTDCGVVCGTGHVFRSRSCTSPLPQHGGNDCSGYALESKECTNGVCPKDIKSCLAPDIQKLVNIQPLRSNYSATPPICPGSNPRQAQLLIQKYCSVTSTEIDWELGIQIFHNCEKVPLYSPLGLINRDTKHKQYGILLDCFRENIQIADLSCSETLEVHNYRLNHTETDFHMLIL